MGDSDDGVVGLRAAPGVNGPDRHREEIVTTHDEGAGQGRIGLSLWRGGGKLHIPRRSKCVIVIWERKNLVDLHVV